MALFGKKQQSQGYSNIPNAASKSQVPLQFIVNSRRQGISDDDVIQDLQRQGFTYQQVFDAMSQADLVPEQGTQSVEMGIGNGTPQYPDFEQMQSPQRQSDNIDVDRIEEVVEAIIDEKWEELSKNINKIVEWKNSVEGNIAKIEEEIKMLQDNFNGINKALMAKLEDYDKNIVNVGTEVRAMEKVFQKVLPVFTNNIIELSRVTKAIKKDKGSKKKK